MRGLCPECNTMHHADDPCPVFCESCDNSSADNASRPSWRWLCLANPRTTGTGYVTRAYWDRDEPYYRCNTINTAGECPDYVERKEPPNGQHE